MRVIKGIRQQGCGGFPKSQQGQGDAGSGAHGSPLQVLAPGISAAAQHCTHQLEHWAGTALVTWLTLVQKQAHWSSVLLSLAASDSCSGTNPPIPEIKGRCEIVGALGCYHKGLLIFLYFVVSLAHYLILQLRNVDLHHMVVVT